MARPKSDAPSIQSHISGQSVVRIASRDYYLGKHGSPESHARYAVLLSEYQKNCCKLPDGFDSKELAERANAVFGPQTKIVETHQANTPILVKHLTAAYREHAMIAYDKSKSELRRILLLCNELDEQDGSMHADEYGPRALQKQRQRWVDSGKARRYCNRLTNLVIRMYRWSVSQELVTENAWSRLRSLDALRIGQTKAKETKAIQPVSLDVVRATIKELPPILRAMIRVHVATGMRPSELCNMRPCDIDRTGVEWMYRPELHKNKNKGKGRAIPILGDAREAITDYLNRDAKSCCFSPMESVSWQQATKRSERKSKVQPSQASRAKDNPEVQPGDRYTQDSYRRAVARACKRAQVAQWHPYQLRHLNLTEIRDVLGVEHAQAMGGHSRIDMTEVYAQQSERRAIEAARHAPTL